MNYHRSLLGALKRIKADGAYLKNGESHYWDKSQPYGQLRWELLEFCIKELEHA